MTEIRPKIFIFWKGGSQILVHLEWNFAWHLLRQSLPSHQPYPRGPYPRLPQGLCETADDGGVTPLYDCLYTQAVLGDGAVDASVTSSSDVKEPCHELHLLVLSSRTNFQHLPMGVEGWLEKLGLG